MPPPHDSPQSVSHPSPERLVAFALGQVDDAEASWIETHVVDCQSCRNTIEAAPNDTLVDLVHVAGTASDRPQAPLRLVAGYDTLDELGRGGMGVVFRARQVALNRMVALKLLAPGNQANPQELARFRRETEAAARLQHPHIVQVYDVGEQDGQPYLAMELLDGGTLADRLTGGPSPPRTAAELLETLARAMHYAHRQGVVHRDLKPANILLDAASDDGAGPPTEAADLSRCTAKIADFGLAKRLDAGTGQTQTGVLLGTPSYMAPEQAAGHSAQANQLSDVYSLGAILYELLVGRPPFRGVNQLETLQQVRLAEPVRPTQLQPTVPRDLETICLKCLEKDPARRYASAEALADDLRRFQESRPVLARPAGFGQRVAKWIKRRPAVAGLIAVCLLALAGLLLGGTVYSVQLRAALRSTEAERERADQNFARSFDAVNRMLTRIALDDLVDVPELEETRRELLADAVALYEELLAQQPKPDAASRSQHQDVLMQLGLMHRLLGHYEPAVRALRRTIELREALLDEFPGRPDYVHALATSRINLGLSYGSRERDSCIEQYQLAIDLLEQITAELPASRQDLALAISNLATQTLDVKQAERYHERALALRQMLVAEAPESTAGRHELALSHYNLGLLYYNTARPADSESAYRQALEIWESLTSAHVRVSRYQSALAECLTSLGTLLHEQGRGEEGEAMVRRGLERRQLLAARFPKIASRQSDLARGYTTLGGLLMMSGRHAEAIEPLSASLRISETVQREHPSAAHRNAVAETLINLATAYSSLQKRDEATAAFRRSLPVFEQLVDEYPQEPRYRTMLGINCMNFSNVLRSADLADALKLNDRSVECLEMVCEALPERSDVRGHLLNAHGARAQTLGVMNRHAEAITSWDRVVELADDAQRRTFRLMRLLVLARADRVRAAQEAAQLAASPAATAPELYNLACIFSLCAAGILETEGAQQLAGVAEAARCADQAVALLSDQRLEAFLKIPANVAHLQADTDLRVLADHAGYQQLVKRLTASQEPAASPAQPSSH